MKKLFKLSLVLCASVLIAVSCSNNNTNPDDTNKTPAPETPKEEPTTIDKEKITAVVQKLGDIEAKVNANGDATTGNVTVKFTLSSSTASDPKEGVYSVDKVEAVKGQGAPANDDKLGKSVLEAAVKEKFKTPVQELTTALTAAGITVDQDKIALTISATGGDKEATLVIPFSETKATNKKGSISIALSLPANFDSSNSVTFDKDK